MVEPLHTAVFTHGHIDHVFGVDLYEEEARTNGWAAPRVIAHAAIAERFERYRMTAGYNAVINQRQFKAPGLRWPTEYRMPDETYTDTLSVTVGGEAFELFHDRGETDDATWVWSPARTRALRGRHVHLGVAELRQPAEGAALRARLGRRVPQDGRARTRGAAARDTDCRSSAPTASAALTEGAELLESLVEQTLALMNEGARLDDIVQTVRARNICSNGRTCTRCTTSPSSSCATSGACTAAGTTAIRRT